MADHLARAVALVTVSSTAALEAIAADIPVLLLDDFGIAPGLINTVFVDSGLFGDADDLRCRPVPRHPRPEWLADNYFHGVGADDWHEQLEQLVARRDVGPAPAGAAAAQSARRSTAPGVGSEAHARLLRRRRPASSRWSSPSRRSGCSGERVAWCGRCFRRR